MMLEGFALMWIDPNLQPNLDKKKARASAAELMEDSDLAEEPVWDARGGVRRVQEPETLDRRVAYSVAGPAREAQEQD